MSPFKSPLPDVHEQVGVYLKKRRKERGKSLVQVGERVGLTGAQIRKYETGQNRISIDMFCKLCVYYGDEPSHIISQLMD